MRWKRQIVLRDCHSFAWTSTRRTCSARPWPEARRYSGVYCGLRRWRPDLVLGRYDGADRASDDSRTSDPLRTPRGRGLSALPCLQLITSHAPLDPDHRPGTPSGRMVRYEGLGKLGAIDGFARNQLGKDVDAIVHIIDACRSLTTDQAEIVATLHACWNDLLIRQEPFTEAAVIDEFLTRWHPKKSRFSRGRLRKAIEWMHANDLVPVGGGSLTSSKRPD